MSEDKQRGYQIVDPGLASPQYSLSDDAQVQCLTYLMRRIPDIASVPQGVLFELISVQYLGGPYPAIGLYTKTPIDTDANLCRLSFAIGEGLERLIERTGVERLMELSSGEDVCWNDVLEPHREALLRRQDEWRR